MVKNNIKMPHHHVKVKILSRCPNFLRYVELESMHQWYGPWIVCTGLVYPYLKYFKHQSDSHSSRD